MVKLIERMKIAYQYRNLFKELVLKDIKLKYRRSFLGYLWSVLNPLFSMFVLVIVFSNMFRFDIEKFPVYLIIGQSIFNAVNEATTMAMWSIVGNAALMKKVYVPKYMFTIARVTSSILNFLFSLAAMVIVLIWCKVSWNWYYLWIPLIIIQVYCFSLGLGMLLAQATVFFRDIQYIYGVFITAWMYLTPIFYPVTMLPDWLFKMISNWNPIYFYIIQFRQIVLEQIIPDGDFVVKGFLSAIIMLFMGIWIFFKTQDKFILYV